MLEKNKNTGEAGFIEVIVVILIALLIMKYYGVTVSEVINWFRIYFADVLK